MGFPPLLNLPTAAMPGQTTKTAITEEFMFQNVAYWPTVYITGYLTNSKFLKSKLPGRTVERKGKIRNFHCTIARGCNDKKGNELGLSMPL